MRAKVNSSWNLLGSLLVLSFIGVVGCVSKRFDTLDTRSGFSASSWKLPYTTNASDVALDDLLFGTELEFTGPSGRVEITPDMFLRELRQKCKEDKSVKCLFETVKNDMLHRYGDYDKVTVTDSSDPNRYIKFSPYADPSVLEVPLAPMSLRQAKERESLVQRYIFDVMADFELVPGNSEYNRWSAHLNFSYPQLQAGTDRGLFLRYFVDLADRPELGSGVFGGDIRNAPLIGMYGDKVRENLEEVVNEFNRKLIARETISSIDFSDRIVRLVYGIEKSPFFEFARYNAINLSHLKSPGNLIMNKGDFEVESAARVEQRSNYVPQSAEHMIFQFEIVARRLMYLQGQSDKRIEYRKSKVPTSQSKTFNRTGPQNGYSANDLAKVYVTFMKEIEMDPVSNAKFLMIPEVRQEVEALIAKE